jgi:hypothetical protein
VSETTEKVLAAAEALVSATVERCAAEIEVILMELRPGFDAARERGDDAAMDRCAARIRTAENCLAAVRSIDVGGLAARVRRS